MRSPRSAAKIRSRAADVAALLDEHRRLTAEGFLDSAPPMQPREAPLAGVTIGAYTLVSRIGHGGMGTVWLASRSDGRFEGRAALKLLNAALVGRGGEERFKREGTILARLTHPHIARLDRRRRLEHRPAVPGARIHRRPPHRPLLRRGAARASRRASACFSTCRRRSRTRTPT